ncbi:hypothetical protein HELRODRAFT_183528 [Helobdella robusta]|uniref:G-protein coupled receptors family 1 profile domain-containing protein n=1 Tax=Helobdella robusta TaxID=6412 RepID=T1FJS8_HELRO|nr:hypothetical protein HELRODRAFT_183528 [Helobdella robusta]ESO10498.1 hypothetical protein HELRODRAFT_183528 [Helobdella robusta]
MNYHTYNKTNDFNDNCINSKLLDNEYLLTYVAVRYCLPTTYVLSTILSTSGNLFWIIFLLKSQKCSKSSNLLLIMNLAVCDFIKSVVVGPLRAFELLLMKFHDYENIEINCCRFLNFISLYLTLVGFHSVLAISQERLVLICYPFLARKWCSRNVTLMVISFIWTSSFVVSLPFSLLYSRTKTIIPACDKVFIICSIIFFHSDEAKSAKAYIFVITIFYCIIPVVIVSISYAKIVLSLNKTIESLRCNVSDANKISEKTLALKKINKPKLFGSSASPHKIASKKTAADNEPGSKVSCPRREENSLRTANSLKIMKGRQTLARMMIVVAVCFIIFQGPMIIMYMCLSCGYKIESNAAFTLILLKWFQLVSSMINPFVYSTGRNVFKKH